MEGFLMSLGGQPLLSKFLPLVTATVLRNPGKGLTLTAVSVALVDPAKTWLDVYLSTIDLPVSLRNWQFTVASVHAARSDTVSMPLGNVKLGLDSEKRSLPVTLKV